MINLENRTDNFGKRLALHHAVLCSAVFMGAASIARSVERLIYFMYAYIQRLWNRCTQNKSSHAPFHLRAHQYDNICLHVRSNYQQTKFGTKEHFIESVLGNTGQSLITISRTVKQVLTST